MSEEERSPLYIYIYSDLDDDFVFAETKYTLADLHILQQENQQLKTQISAREEEYKKLEDNWDKLKEFLETNWKETQDIWFIKILNKMQELERGVSDVG